MEGRIVTQGATKHSFAANVLLIQELNYVEKDRRSRRLSVVESFEAAEYTLPHQSHPDHQAGIISTW